MWPQIRRRLDGDDEPAEPVEEEEADVLTQQMMLSSPTTISMRSNTDVVRFLDAL